MYENLHKWTLPPYYFGETWPDYYSSGVGQSRDSDALARSNFRSMLSALSGESETVLIVRESHFLVGWVEWIAIHESDDKALSIADAIQAALSEYPIVNEEDYSDLEWTEAADYWDAMSPREKVRWAIGERKQYHWLAKEPVWRYGRYDYSTLANLDSPIASALCEHLRSN